MRINKRGFTLPELLLAAAILALVMVSLLFLFTTCLFLNESSRNLTIAASHGQFVMEDIKNTNFTQIPAMAGAWDTAAITSAGLTPITGESIIITVNGADPLNINVAVNWNDRGVRSRNIAIATLITRP